MPPVSRDTFATHLRRLDGETLAGFVAAVWAARGWQTRVEDRTVVAERGGDRRRLRVHPAGSAVAIPFRSGPPSLDGADVLVVARDTDRLREAAAAGNVAYVPPEELRRRLLYAIPRERAARIYAAYVGESLREPADEVSAGEDGGATVGAGRVAVAVLLLGAAVVAAVAGPGGFGFDTVGGPGQQVATPAARFDGPAGTATASTATPTGTPTESAYPPGLSAEGVVNASLLAEAHLSQITNRQYAVDLLFSGPPEATGFEQWSMVRWRFATGGSRNFVVNATYRGKAMDPSPVNFGAYADGVVLYRRVETPNTTRFTATPAGAADASAYAYFGRTLVERYLATSQSRVEVVRTENGTRYLVVATGTPDHLSERAAGYRARAWVTPEGRVVSLSVQYATGTGGHIRPVRVGLEYHDYGTARVEEPAWVATAMNETER